MGTQKGLELRSFYVANRSTGILGMDSDEVIAEEGRGQDLLSRRMSQKAVLPTLR
jgi:hypothetical protein